MYIDARDSHMVGVVTVQLKRISKQTHMVHVLMSGFTPDCNAAKKSGIIDSQGN